MHGFPPIHIVLLTCCVSLFLSFYSINAEETCREVGALLPSRRREACQSKQSRRTTLLERSLFHPVSDLRACRKLVKANILSFHTTHFRNNPNAFLSYVFLGHSFQTPHDVTGTLALALYRRTCLNNFNEQQICEFKNKKDIIFHLHVLIDTSPPLLPNIPPCIAAYHHVL